MKVLKSIDEIKSFFSNNSTPIYFISASSFNLMGIDKWVNNFHFITYIDSFDGKYEHLFSPKEEVPHEEFQSIEDINNYLLKHPEVISLINKNGKPNDNGKVLFLMFDEQTEKLAKLLNLEVYFPSAELRNALDHKVNTNRIAEKQV